MKKILSIVAVLIVITAGSTALAFDREADAVQRGAFEFLSFDGMDLYRAYFNGQYVIPPYDDWAVQVGFAFGEVRDGPNLGGYTPDYWLLEGGFAYKLNDFTKLGILGRYQFANSGDEFEETTAMFTVMQRLAHEDAEVIPHLDLSIGISDVKFGNWLFDFDDNFQAVKVTVGGGVDWSLRPDLALRTSIAYQESATLGTDDFGLGDYAQGWIGSLQLIYFFQDDGWDR
jgi:hypothetical protein